MAWANEPVLRFAIHWSLFPDHQSKTLKGCTMIFSLSRRRNEFLSVAGFVLVLISAAYGRAQQSSPDIQGIIKETQQTSQSPGAVSIVWWIPEAFIRASLATNASMTEEKSEAFVKPLRNYILIIVVDAKVGPLAGFNYTPPAELASEVQLKDRAGNLYPPVDPAQINSDSQNFIAILKPVMASMLGPMGQNMNFLVFPSRDKSGAAIADESREGVFYLEVGKKEFRWRLPLGSILPHKTCPVCKEILSGAYKYCPYDGTKLPEFRLSQPPQKP